MKSMSDGCNALHDMYHTPTRQAQVPTSDCIFHVINFELLNPLDSRLERPACCRKAPADLVPQPRWYEGEVEATDQAEDSSDS